MVESDVGESPIDAAPDLRNEASRNAHSLEADGVSEQADIQFASKTDVGQVRSANEDSCDSASRPDGTRLLVVADGMGGHRGGATASQTAIDTIREIFESDPTGPIDEMLREAIESANSRVFEMAQDDAELEGMGTTVVAFVLDARQQATVAHVGDSRAYRYRKGKLEPLTTDHSVVAEMQRRGLLSAEEASTHPRRNEILRSVGVVADVDVEVASVEIEPGDRFLLCSDGLSGVLSDDEIAAIVQTQSADQAVETLVAMANERGGPDNITVQILAIPASETQGDPEATAPVQLSQVGIEAIESKRRQRQLMRRLGTATLVLAVLSAIAFLGWRFLGGSQPAAPPDALPASPAAPPSRSLQPRPPVPPAAEPAPPAGRPADALEGSLQGSSQASPEASQSASGEAPAKTDSAAGSADSVPPARPDSKSGQPQRGIPH